jgi:hypothetical protein
VKQGAGRAVQRPGSPTQSHISVRSAPAPIIIYLSGHAQTNDRLAMREIARQLVLQSGEALDVPLGDDNLEADDEDGGPAGVQVVSRASRD